MSSLHRADPTRLVIVFGPLWGCHSITDHLHFTVLAAFFFTPKGQHRLTWAVSKTFCLAAMIHGVSIETGHHGHHVPLTAQIQV
eukprot:CAMPEP_0174363854 /NCGR_PEP_ID=MMETSP0811_2-20130205/70520_1 /TAXON_ID=73025 ORGANISM="Eutreptiella gymnastica-like, Strain CCMP1594" /NCGR_SAMPLE_ID=MMETSP0811_2 /ASSEMBLY_ACC=CAM_ASM_000667 /LENGTH=83 /DNA_ID=CAMNT_0015502935 /DNA_START=41 /DNA_END=292 /DNA_ORIENTATION=+